MGSWDGAEVADLVGLYLLSQLTDLPIDVGLYRDDGLAVCRLSGRQAELTKKKLCAIFKDNGLNITAEANRKDVNFLDINLNLDTGIYRPYMKPNDSPLYVNKNSNHPRGILENIPHSVNRRLSMKVQKSEEVQPEPGCNCSGVMGSCPLEGKCLVESVVYRAEVKDGNNNLETYTGVTAGTFKKRYYSHQTWKKLIFVRKPIFQIEKCPQIHIFPNHIKLT